jgi:hypothetical protein
MMKERMLKVLVSEDGGKLLVLHGSSQDAD